MTMGPKAQKVAAARAAWEKNPTPETHLAHMKAKRAYNKSGEFYANRGPISWERMMSE